MKFWKIPYWQLLVIPVLCYCLGATSNKVVKAFNHNQMPVLLYGTCTEERSKDLPEEITCMNKNSHLNVLGDWIDLHDYFASPGDVLLAIEEVTFRPFLLAWILLAIVDLKKAGY